MKYIRIFLAVFLGLLLLIILIATWFVHHTVPDYSGELKVAGVKQEVSVYFDSLGIPHIYAQSEADAFFALGYVQAQDRLFQMELLRRVGSGRLAEVLGSELIPIDKFFRTIGIPEQARSAASTWDTIKAPWKASALSYIDGINAFIDQGPSPEEFLLLGIKPAHFTPTDLYMISGYMAFTFAEALKTDPIVTRIAVTLGPEYLVPFGIETPVDSNFSKSGVTKTVELSSLAEQVSNLLPFDPWIGSNGWVMASSKSASGKPLLANDTHIGYQQPCVWYEAHLNYPGHEIYGHFLAGLPFPLTGHTAKHAWGLTMFENDDINLYVETMDSDSTYIHKGISIKLGITTDTITVKGSKPEPFYIRSTVHGPLVNGIIPHLPDSAETPVSIWWSYTQLPANAPEATYDLMHAKTLQGARLAASHINAPGLNIVYANQDGDIAHWGAGKIPVFENPIDTRLMMDGASGVYDPIGFLDFSLNPQSENPASGIIISANQAPRDSFGKISVTGYYVPDDRYNRIQLLLNAQPKWNLEGFKRIQRDVTSNVQANNAKLVALILAESLATPQHSAAIQILMKWDGDHSIDEVAPSLWYTTLAYILKMAMEDELGEFDYSIFVNSHCMKNAYTRFLENADNPWWDNTQTRDRKETRQEIFDSAFKAAIDYLEKEHGKSPTLWKWGEQHTLTHRHVAGKVKPLNLLFNVGPFKAAGGIETINNAGFPMYTGVVFEVKYGAAMRNLVDLADPKNAYSILPTGQSGHFRSPHYDDQSESYNDGLYRPMLMNESTVRKFSDRMLILKPY